MKVTAELCETIAMKSSQDMLERMPSWISGNISKADQPLLIGLTLLLKPVKVVEIGVASGWSGCLFIDALQKNNNNAEYIGVDFSQQYFLDSTKETGSAIAQLFPESDVKKRLLLGGYAIDYIDDIGKGVDLAFIDGDHKHPWAILDLLSLLPVLSPDAYVLIHDINLSTYIRHEQANRGPKYLFECWPLEKIHSSQVLTMIGAIKLPSSIEGSLLTTLLNTVYTPWEINVDVSVLNKIARSISQNYGNEWGQRFQAAFHKMNLSKENNVGNFDFIESLIRVVSQHPRSISHLNMLQSAEPVFPQSSKLQHHISVLHYRNNNLEKAIDHSLRAVKIDGANAHYISFLGELYLRTNDIVKAEAYLSEAVRLQDNVAIFHYRLALALEKSERIKDSIISANRASDLAPGNVDFSELLSRLKNHPNLR